MPGNSGGSGVVRPSRASWVPPAVDMSLPSAARVYDAYLGGAHNFEVDRRFAARAEELLPHVKDVARRNRTFLRQAVRYAAETAGITQFLDIGCGLPVTGAVHEVAREFQPDARVLYADNEPVAVTQGEMMLRDEDRATIIHGDLRFPESVLHAAATRELLDFDRPVCVLMVALVHFVPDAENPVALLARYRDALAPGSLLALSHATVDGVPEPVRGQTMDFINSYAHTQNPGFVARTRAEFLALLDGFDLVDPGVTYTPQWRPDRPVTTEDHPERAVCFAAVGRVPD
ncbi:SAM-dependent methyltransferase [Saccharopolyspora sp. HNM0983]|uniref:SAM-dependent methyltransferase n=1 Tax=Saccharopolyspora montiporae TaxID=2781240 RepID=A0A929B8N6_9PSEU|nr:SAM-dependent methyltransferase [Saccharopolyspora sp. HNM0983]MBE9375287.1 SAM-dependent methyltransferase [Saccharopolyspora sp. HNM0983]